MSGLSVHRGLPLMLQDRERGLVQLGQADTPQARNRDRLHHNSHERTTITDSTQQIFRTCLVGAPNRVQRRCPRLPGGGRVVRAAAAKHDLARR
jgi:hypothetical protein